MKNSEEHLIERARVTIRENLREEDRRVRRSRKMLKQGLLELMKSRRFSEISVRDITDLVDMNRGTFYLHYTGTADLLKSIEDDMEAEIQAVVDAHIGEAEDKNSLRPVFEPILDFIIEHRETCESLFYNNEVSGFFERLEALCRKNGREIVRLRYPSVAETRMPYLLSSVTYGMIGVLKTWFERDMDLSKAELLQMAERLLDGAAAQMM